MNISYNSEYGMYYYYNEETGESTWSYPASTAQDTGVGNGKNALAYSAATSESPSAPTAPSAAPLENYGYGRTNMMMWRSDLSNDFISRFSFKTSGNFLSCNFFPCFFSYPGTKKSLRRNISNDNH